MVVADDWGGRDVERERMPLFGGMTFFAMRHSGETCGSNGLPLTPNSITILGRSQFLKTLSHPNLCAYLDVIRGKHERSVVACEYHGTSLSTVGELGEDDIIRLARQTLGALAYLNKNGIMHRNLSPENILVTYDMQFKLFNFGLHYMTGAGKDVLFPIGCPKYMAPEVLLAATGGGGMKADVWSLGMVLAEAVLGRPLWPGLRLGQVLRKVLALVHSGGDMLARLARDIRHEKGALYMNLNAQLRDLINQCLNVDPRKRPTPAELTGHALFKHTDIVDNKQLLSPCQGSHRCPLRDRRLQELYYWWHLAGGDVQSELKKQGLIRSKAPILSLCDIVLLEGTSFGQTRDQATMLDLRVVPLSLNSLVQRLSHLPITAYYPLIETKSRTIEIEEQSDAAELPLVIRERDTEYQFRRVVLYDRLLQGYPYKKSTIVREARKDIPPLLRGELWAALLDVAGNIAEQYTLIDKDTPTVTDRQIEVDIPRCHQYNELLSSRDGHRKFRRVLKAWVNSHPHYVYWQGLDSLCAPFLYLNFNNEACAYGCLSAFVPKYLNQFFLKDNSAVIREYLAKFSHLIAFHDPSLANHLHEIAFVPELFAIPWFLTMFSHVFPLHKIFHLWDKLLLGDASFPLFIGLAILQQLRETLLGSGFNECILLFSDLPEIDMERCVKESVDMYCCTPRSVTYRQYELRSESRVSPLHPQLEMVGQPVWELQSEFCARISGADLLELINTKFSRPKVLVVDVRERHEYGEEAVQGSINIPLSGVDVESEGGDPGSALPPSPELSILYNNKGKVIIVAGPANGLAANNKFCRLLVRCGFPRVCCLHGGIEVLRCAEILGPIMS